MRQFLWQFVCVLLVMGHSTTVVAEAGQYYLDLSVGYSRGDYGTAQQSELTQVTMSYGHVKEEYDYSITLPYLFLSDVYGSQQGIGDITLRGALRIAGNSINNDVLYAALAVKLPTASDTKGLGTGEMDVGGFLVFTHYFNNTQLSLNGGYILTGDSPDQTYRDIGVYGIGLSHTVPPWYVYASLDGQQGSQESSDDPFEFSAGFFYQVGPAWFVRAEGLLGLSEASPDHGISIGVVKWF